ncbi:unnamed protein product [Symbiodinium pilosum]|uniref:ABC1 atypical kinase-like domain-containing protein n=1 Tax=Symbiodinium pilosum TaxID=2952 RepID=A0A812W017_SYMPI|nr:unnamed protein product [Symbiodinium pilosum]
MVAAEAAATHTGEREEEEEGEEKEQEQSLAVAVVSAKPSAEDAALVRAMAPNADLKRILGAGCIARVYEGTLVGRPVAIKIRRDNVEEFLQLDFQFLRFAASLAETLWPNLKWLMLQSALQDFKQYMLSQVDFRHEASNLRRFAENFHHSAAQVPKVFAASEQVLIMEGQSLSTFLQQETDPVLRKKVWSMLSDQAAKMVLVDNFLHADLHPGNILVTMERGRLGSVVPKLTFIDAGMALELPKALVGQLSLAMHGALNNNADQLGQALVDLHCAEGLCVDPSPSLPHRLGVLGLCCVFTCDEPLWSQLFKTRADYIGARTPEYFHRMAAIMTEHEVRVSPVLWSLLTSFALVEGSLHELGFKTNVMRACLPYLMSNPVDILRRALAGVQCTFSEMLNV